MKPKGTRELRGTLTVSDIKDLQSALFHAELNGCAADPMAQKAMELYLRTWVAGPIRRVLARLERKHSGRIIE